MSYFCSIIVKASENRRSVSYWLITVTNLLSLRLNLPFSVLLSCNGLDFLSISLYSEHNQVLSIEGRGSSWFQFVLPFWLLISSARGWDIWCVLPQLYVGSMQFLSNLTLTWADHHLEAPATRTLMYPHSMSAC